MLPAAVGRGVVTFLWSPVSLARLRLADQISCLQGGRPCIMHCMASHLASSFWRASCGLIEMCSTEASCGIPASPWTMLMPHHHTLLSTAGIHCTVRRRRRSQLLYGSPCVYVRSTVCMHVYTVCTCNMASVYPTRDQRPCPHTRKYTAVAASYQPPRYACYGKCPKIWRAARRVCVSSEATARPAWGSRHGARCSTWVGQWHERQLTRCFRRTCTSACVLLISSINRSVVASRAKTV